MQNAQTIPEMLKIRVDATPDQSAHYTLDENGQWRQTTWQSFFQSISAIAAGLQKVGIRPGDNVGIMAPTSQSWEFVQMALLMSGAVVVGIDPNEIRENINHIVKKAELAGIIIQRPSLMEKIEPVYRSGLKVKISMETVEYPEKSFGCFSLDQIKELKGSNSILAEAKGVATIIFTSGTTGEPKGIAYRHEQVIAACRSILEGFDDMDGDCNFPCWLSLSNLFQRMINLCAIDLGGATYFVDDPRKIISLLPKINPHLFIGVPRIFEKLYEAIEAQIQSKSLWQQKFIRMAVDAGDEYASAVRDKAPLSFFKRQKYQFMDSLVLKKIRSFLGANMKYLISGSAPMPRWLLEKYHALGILVLEAYGISENIIPNAMNLPSAYRFGSVGRPRPENEIRILDDGEMMVRGVGVFDGYYGDASGKAAFTPDGFFPTGDYVAVDADGYLFVTGRKSEVFKTSTGRKIAPAGIEERLRQATYVEHAVVFGAGRKFIIALVTVSEELMPAQMKEVTTENRLSLVAEEMNRLLSPLPGFQRPAGVLVTETQFSVENKELTSNFKLKRKNIEERFREQIEGLYLHLETGEAADMGAFVQQDKLLMYWI